MSLFDELVFDALCGHRGRFIPGMPLEQLRQEKAQLATVPVPRSVPVHEKFTSSPVSTRQDYLMSTEPYIGGWRF